MKNANWTRILTILLCLLALYALLAVLAGIVQRFIVPVLLVILATILAFILTPVVHVFQHRFHLFRWMAILTTYLMVGAILAILGYFLTSPLVDQTKSLASALKNPTHLENVFRVRATTKALLVQATRYDAQVSPGLSTTPSSPAILPGPPSSTNPAPCYAAIFLNQIPEAVSNGLWRGAGCTKASEKYWTRQPGIGRPLPPILATLKAQVSDLRRTSVTPTAKEVAQQHGSEASIPATKVPPSYSKPVVKDLAQVTKDIGLAKADVKSQSGTYSQDAAKVFKDVKRLDKDTVALYAKVKSTPILIMALQNQVDSHNLPVNIGSLIGSAVSKLRGQGTTVLDNAVTILTGTINVIFDLLIVIIMSLYLLADGSRFIGWVMHLVPERHRDQAWFFVASLDRVLGGYIRGQVIVAITIGILAGTGSYVIGVPYALLIGIFAFLAESIPVIGPILASVPAILVSLFTLPLLKTAIVVAWFLFIQQIEQNVVGPRITGHAVGIHPVAAMVAIIIGLEIGGFWGAFLAVPVTGILFVIVGEAYNYLVLRQPLPTAEMPESVEVVVDFEGSRGPPAGK